MVTCSATTTTIGKRSNAVRSHLSLGSDLSAFEGANPEAGVVLGLRTEQIKKKVAFDIFTEKIQTILCMSTSMEET